MTEHDVILYGNDSAALTQCVVPLIASGLQDGGAAVVIAAPDHERAFRSALSSLFLDGPDSSTHDRLIFLDAFETLKSVMINGEPDPKRFSRIVGSTVRRLSERYEVHAYGEMVGLLRSDGKHAAAAAIEQFWNELLEEIPFRLLCGYPIDVLGSEFHPDQMDVILASHTKLISVLGEFCNPLSAEIESAVGSRRTSAIRGMVTGLHRPGWATLGEPEATLLWLRQHFPDSASYIIDRAKARLG